MNIDKSLKQEDERLFKQRLQRVHAITGIIFSLFMSVVDINSYLGNLLCLYSPKISCSVFLLYKKIPFSG